MNSRELFQRDKQRAQWLKAITDSEKWAEASTYALSSMAQSGATHEQLEGARRFSDALVELTAPEEATHPLTSGVQHRIPGKKKFVKSDKKKS